MNWIEAKLYTTSEGTEAVAAMLMECGINGIQIEDFDEFKHFIETNKEHWDYVDDELFKNKSEEVCVTSYIPENEYLSDTIKSIETAILQLKNAETGLALGTLKLELKNVNDESWLNAWKQYYKPFPVGKSLVVRPEWEQYENKEDKLVISMNPAHVFGTGLHQTTKLCMEQLETHVKSGNTVLDLGCGSGILSITSLLLGAEKAFAVDIDPEAIKVAYGNASLNNIDKEQYTVVSGNVLVDSLLRETICLNKYDIVVANIVADVVIALSNIVTSCIKQNGIFITSGIIKERLQDVYDALSENSFEVVDTFYMDDWVCVVSCFK